MIAILLWTETETICNALHAQFLADRTATQYDRLLASSCRPSVRPSVCDATLCIMIALGVGVQG